LKADEGLRLADVVLDRGVADRCQRLNKNLRVAELGLGFRILAH